MSISWYKREPDKALAGMIALTLEERGAYNTIIDLLYARDGNVADDRDLLKVLGCHGKKWNAIKATLIEKGKIWIGDDGKIHNGKADELLKTIRKGRENVVKAARKRWVNGRASNEINDLLDVETETETETEKKKTKAKKEAVQGTRLPDDWQPTLEDLAKVKEVLREDEIPYQLESFRDHWKASAQPNAVKKNWSSAFRNWCRIASERKGQRGKTGPSGSQGRPKTFASYARQIIEESAGEVRQEPGFAETPVGGLAQRQGDRD